MKVLVIDNDPSTAGLIEQALLSSKLVVKYLPTAENAISVIKTFEPELIILEVDLAETNGIDLCVDIRAFLDVTIVFYSEKNEEFIQVLALDSGADDFILKSKKPYYLRSKLNALLRKNLKEFSEDRKLLVDPESRVVRKDGRTIYLSKKEFDIFHLLFSRPNQILHRSEILKELWNNTEEKTRMLDVHISHLREKIGENVIKTVKGIGYGFIERT